MEIFGLDTEGDRAPFHCGNCRADDVRIRDVTLEDPRTFAIVMRYTRITCNSCGQVARVFPHD